MHTLGAYVHIHTKYEVPMFKPVARRVVHRQQHRVSMIVKALVDKPNDPKTLQDTYNYF